MKVRNGFVSNSSSSSFILAYSLITDEEKARAAIGTVDVEIYTETELEDAIKNARWCTPLECDWADVYQKMKKTGNPEQLHAVFSDCDDIYEDGDSEPNYDVDFDDFSSAKWIDETFTTENGFKDVSIQYGAGRNG